MHNLEDTDVEKAFELSKTVSSETFLHSFQFKILNDIIYLNARLAKIGYVASELCTFCGVCYKTHDHLFYQCTYSKSLWTEFEKHWLTVSKLK